MAVESQTIIAQAIYAGQVPQHLSDFIKPRNGVFGRKEPVQSPFFWCAIVLPWFAIPFYRNGDGIEEFIGGTPTWAFTAVMVLLFSHLLLVLVCFLTWDTSVAPPVVESASKAESIKEVAEAAGEANGRQNDKIEEAVNDSNTPDHIIHI